MTEAIDTANRDKVLVVDDEPHMRETLAEILSDEGYQVLIAATGEEAIELC